ncbi:holo-ACP synthase [Rhodonellum sp.]|uniref:holo-ACP synthase n=1 Tax=Rhodonellum sp. TaxID=2231180 RepID=UPI002726F103|nr:holo-ACP synthase [Rhodonellum sp.]MDO9551565.1 holo-ACP synthase [Rhodonellum sp.]
MILGVGTDIESVARIRRIWEQKPNLLTKIFFDSELEYANTKNKPWETLTGIWCAKEAVVKSISTQLNVSLQEVEIYKPDPQQFEVIIHHELFRSEAFNFSLSISHAKEYATALCVVETK